MPENPYKSPEVGKQGRVKRQPMVDGLARKLVVFCAYQLAVLLFVAGGGFVHIYDLLGYSSNDGVGLKNVAHTTVCWIVVELPLLVAVVWSKYASSSKNLSD